MNTGRHEQTRENPGRRRARGGNRCAPAGCVSRRHGHTIDLRHSPARVARPRYWESISSRAAKADRLGDAVCVTEHSTQRADRRSSTRRTIAKGGNVSTRNTVLACDNLGDSGCGRKAADQLNGFSMTRRKRA
jgi:hypothetical protein